jgi:hypothetical protein
VNASEGLEQRRASGGEVADGSAISPILILTITTVSPTEVTGRTDPLATMIDGVAELKGPKVVKLPTLGVVWLVASESATQSVLEELARHC